MSLNSEAETEARILDFVKQNPNCTALKISRDLGIQKTVVNKHLYKLQELKMKAGSPPVWDLKKETEEPKPARKSDTAAPQKDLTQILSSGGKSGLKAHQIARELGQPRKSVNKRLYEMREKGDVEKTDGNVWSVNTGKKSDQSESCEDIRLTSGSGLSRFDGFEKLGEGGFGCVFKVRHTFEDKMYALKIVELTEKAGSEVKALVRLDHPNIVRYVTCWPSSENWKSHLQDMSNQSVPSIDIVFEGTNHEVSDDVTSGMESLSITGSEIATKPSENQTCLFIQMEFCEGGTLTTWIDERNFETKQRITTEINKIFYEIVSGVEYVHLNNLIHRDLKPDNILFGAGGKVKIGDFGLVAALRSPDGASTYKTKGRGTPTYMSPEQNDQSNYDEKTDIFPLGLIWFEMLWKLSTGSERAKLLSNLRKQTFPDGFRDQFQTEHNFIRKMLSHKPEERPRAAEMKENLDNFFSVNVLSQKTI